MKHYVYTNNRGGPRGQISLYFSRAHLLVVYWFYIENVFFNIQILHSDWLSERARNSYSPHYTEIDNLLENKTKMEILFQSYTAYSRYIQRYDSLTSEGAIAVVQSHPPYPRLLLPLPHTCRVKRKWDSGNENGVRPMKHERMGTRDTLGTRLI